MKFLHETCLNRWRLENIGTRLETHCNVCNSSYQIPLDRPQTAKDMLTICWSFFLLLCFLIGAVFVFSTLLDRRLTDRFQFFLIYQLGLADSQLFRTITELRIAYLLAGLDETHIALIVAFVFFCAMIFLVQLIIGGEVNWEESLPNMPEINLPTLQNLRELAPNIPEINLPTLQNLRELAPNIPEINLPSLPNLRELALFVNIQNLPILPNLRKLSPIDNFNPDPVALEDVFTLPSISEYVNLQNVSYYINYYHLRISNYWPSLTFTPSIVSGRDSILLPRWVRFWTTTSSSSTENNSIVKKEL